MNNFNGVGRLSQEPELRYTPSGTAVCNITIAINRMPYNGQEQGADFINVIVWGKMGEACANNLQKGRLVSVEGRLQTRSYKDSNDIQRRAWEIVANRVQFLDYAKEQRHDQHVNANQPQHTQSNENPFEPDTYQINEDELPFEMKQ